MSTETTAPGMSEPLTDERLAEIRAAHAGSLLPAIALSHTGFTVAWSAVPGLLDEVERLRGELNLAIAAGYRAETENEWLESALLDAQGRLADSGGQP